MVMPGDEMSASTGDGGCMAENPLGAHNKARFTEAGSCMADGTTYVAGNAAAEVG